MDFLAIEQVWALAMFFLGSTILSTCSKWEKEEQTILKESKSYGRRKSDLVKPRTFRRAVMTLLGAGLFLGGGLVAVIFFLSIPRRGTSLHLASKELFSA